MNDENSFGSFLKQRSVLGDLSNYRNGKRGFPLNPGCFTLEKGKAHRKNIEGDEKGKLPTWVYTGLENLDKGKENISPENAADAVDKSLPLLKAKRGYRSMDPENGAAMSQETAISDESKEVLSSPNGELHPVSGDTVILGTMEGEVSRESRISSSSAHGKAGKPSPVLDNAGVADGVKEGSVSHAFGRSNIENLGQFFALNASNYECMDSQLSSMFVDAIPSQESVNNSSSTLPSGSKVVELNFDASSNSHGCFNANGGSHLETACSCSFCMKAAYLWLDLHYQDLKGRLAALSKSMRYARLLVRDYNHDDIQSVAGGGSNSKLEFDLMNQWKSLFHHTEDVLVRESAQLQSSLSSLGELRRNSERDLEMAIRMHSCKP